MAKKSCNQLLLIDWFRYVCAHQDLFTNCHNENLSLYNTTGNNVDDTYRVHTYRGHKEYIHTKDTRSIYSTHNGHKEYIQYTQRTQGVQYVVQNTAKSHDDRPHQETGCILVKMLIRVDYTAGIYVQQFHLVDPFPPISRHHTCRGYVCRQLSTIKMYVSMVFVWWFANATLAYW